MTDKEAIKYLGISRRLLDAEDETSPIILEKQSLDLAIKALEEKSKRHWGNWIITEVQCPKCFNYVEPDCFSIDVLTKCPNCGADMWVENYDY